jgi:hypothetical protein
MAQALLVLVPKSNRARDVASPQHRFGPQASDHVRGSPNDALMPGMFFGNRLQVEIALTKQPWFLADGRKPEGQM